MRIAICENEAPFLSFLSERVSAFFAGQNIAPDIDAYAKGEAFLLACQKGKRYDLVLMDIGLEDSDGMEIAEDYRSLDAEAFLIFITAIDSRAIEGYDVAAFGYIVKNTVEERLPALLARFWEELHAKGVLIVNSGNAHHILPANNVYSVESHGRGTLLRTAEGVLQSAESIRHVAESLPAGHFVECHKSVFVNAGKIKRIDKDSLTLTNEQSYPVSRRNRRAVFEAVMRKVGSG